MRLAHLSDFHLGGPDPKRQRRVERLVGLVLDDRVDHLLLGGDLVDSANLRDAQPLLDLLVKRGFFSSDRLSVVPGNHDIWPYGESDLLGNIAKAVIYDAQSLILGGDWPAQKNYERFADVFRDTFSGSERHSEKNPYPCIKKIGSVAILMLDTTSAHGYHRSPEGRFDEDEAQFALDTLSSHRGPKILLMHHQPWRFGRLGPTSMPEPIRAALEALGIPTTASMDFVDLASIREFIREAGFDAVLHGHVHLNGSPRRQSAYARDIGAVPVYGMGRSAGVDQDPDRAVFAWHIIEASKRGVTVETHFVEADELD